MMNRFTFTSTTLLAAVFGSTVALADEISIVSSKDNTLFGEVFDDLSNGAGSGMYAGKTGVFAAPNLLRRALVQFDLSAIPAKATITGARLDVMCTKSPDDISRTFTLHRLTSDWGEGASSSAGGAGSFAEDGDATWVYNFWQTSSWTTPGGDFLEAVSSTTQMEAEGAYTFPSTDQMIDDVQIWLDNPSENFGWLIKGNEVDDKTARRIGTREQIEADERPYLVVEYEIGGSTPGDFTGDGQVDGADLGLMLAVWGPCSGCPEDLNGDGEVSGADLGLLLSFWSI